MLTAKIIRTAQPFAWDVVDSEGRYLIRAESYGVACAVEYAFNHRRAWEPTEAFAIAEAHHAALRQWGKE